MSECKKDITPVRYQWSYIFLAPTHRYILYDTGKMQWMISSTLWLLMAWCFSTRSSVTTVLNMHPCISSFLQVNPYHVGPGKLDQFYSCSCPGSLYVQHDEVIKWKHFPRYWPFVQGIHQSPVNSPHKGQWCRALMFSLIWAWINSSVSNRGAGDLRRHGAHYDITITSPASNVLMTG